MSAVYSEIRTPGARAALSSVLRGERHYRVIWHGLLDCDLLTIGSAAEGVRHQVPAKDGSQKVRLPRFVSEVLGKSGVGSLLGVMLFEFDGTEDCGFLVVEREADAEELGRALAASARRAAAIERLEFGYISLEIEAAEWNTPVDAPLYLPVGGRRLYALQVKKTNGELKILQRVPQLVEESAPDNNEFTGWTC